MAQKQSFLLSRLYGPHKTAIIPRAVEVEPTSGQYYPARAIPTYRVVVPKGLRGKGTDEKENGDKFEIMLGNTSKRMTVTVPHGRREGDTFLVRIPRLGGSPGRSRKKRRRRYCRRTKHHIRRKSKARSRKKTRRRRGFNNQ